jgi:hypothetical protein
MSWIIVNSKNPDECWSNDFGWTEEEFDTFDDNERETLNLPIDGEWRQVLWTKEN